MPTSSSDRSRPSRQVDRAAAVLQISNEVFREAGARASQRKSIGLDTILDREAGLDSLTVVELIGRVERLFDLRFPERIYGEVETPRDILRALASAQSSDSAIEQAGFEVPDLASVEGEPSEATTLTEVLHWHVAAHPERPQITFLAGDDENTSITYRDLQEEAGKVAAGLQDLGLQPGEPVSLILPTGRDYFFSFLGVQLAGGIPVPLYPPTRWTSSGDHLRRHCAILNNCASPILVTVPEGRQLAQLLRSRVEPLREIAAVAELSTSTARYREPALHGGSTAFLQYTSGSTGYPKGVVLSHANLLNNIRAMGVTIEASSNDVFVSWLPLYHDMGLIGAWFGSFYYAMRLAIMPPTAFVARPRRWFEAVHRHRGTLSAAPNFAYELCLGRIGPQDLEGIDLSSWRVAFNGAEPVHPETVERFCDRFEKCGFRRETMKPVYGLAECSVGLTFPPLPRGPVYDTVDRIRFTRTGHAREVAGQDRATQKFVACGMPLPGHEVRIVDAGSRELPERREGRVQFRGPSAASGYFRNAGETQKLFDGDWLDPGDLGYIAGGDLYITGRSRDVIIKAGRNIYPQELEQAVGAIAGVITCNVAVFGSEDRESGSEKLIVMAEVRTRKAEALDRIRTEVNALATELVGTPPDDIALVPPRSVLKTSSGKIRRAASRELYERRGIDQSAMAQRWLALRSVLLDGGTRIRGALRALGGSAYACLVWTLFTFFAPFVWSAVVLLPRSRWRWSAMRCAGKVLSTALRIPLGVEGVGNCDESRPFLLVCNHASYLDSYALVAALPFEIRFVAKSELKGNPFIRIFLARLGTEYVERFDTERGIEDTQRIAGSMADKRPLLYFAEGSFTRMPGLLAFQMGAFVAAASAGIDVIPMAIRGTRSILRADSWFPRPGSITITMGPPIRTEKILRASGGDRWQAALGLRRSARQYILRFCGEPDLAHERAPIFELRDRST